MSFDDARQIADAVLLEGYVLYPYRASAPKNRFRWAFGVLAPRAWSDEGGCEPSWMQTDLLVEATPTTAIDVRLRFLRNRRRTVERIDEGGYSSTDSLENGADLHVPWDEGEVQELDFGRLVCSEAEPLLIELPFELPASWSAEAIRSDQGRVIGRVVRSCESLSGVVRVTADPIASDRPLVRVRLRVENTTPWEDLDARREVVIPACLIATHLLIQASDGAFLSVFDPPDWACDAAQESQFVRSYPVLVGRAGQRDLMLSAPIILYDYPTLAPESPGDLFDATEIDELLTLRTQMLTDEEKRQARATDPRAARVIEQVDAMPPEVFARLHGAMRDLQRAEMVPRGRFPPDQPSAHGFEQGKRVRLLPGQRRTDAQDLLFAGCEATIQAVLRDVDDQEVLAVTIDEDPAAELHRWYGRFRYYYPDEVESLEPEGSR